MNKQVAANLDKIITVLDTDGDEPEAAVDASCRGRPLALVAARLGMALTAMAESTEDISTGVTRVSQEVRE
jgi:hypothetical protein